MIAFFQSLGLFGYILLAIVALLLWNARRLIFLRSPLDSQQHKNWRGSVDEGVYTNPDHLDPKGPKT